MKSSLSFLLLILSPTTFGQGSEKGIDFWGGDFETAKQTAQQTEKLLFVDVFTSWCKPCKQMDKYVFPRKEVGERFNDYFVNVKINAESKVGIPIAKEYGILSYPSYIFLTPSGDLIYKVKGAMTPDQLIDAATKAISLAKDYKPLEELNKAYENGERNPKILYEYIRQKALKDGRQPKLLEEFVATIPKSEQRTEKVLEIIAKNITSVDNQGFKILRASLSAFDQLNEKQRNAVISGISTAKRLTFKQVVETNDEQLFERLLAAVHATAYSSLGANEEAKQFRFDYAKITQNFPLFRSIAEKQGELLLLKTSVELAFETQQTIVNFKEQAAARNLNNKAQQYQLMLKSLEYGAEKATSYQLNELAWGYVIMAETTGDLEKALRWSERSLELYTSPANLDTKAHLLYSLGKRKNAISTAKSAIKLGKKMGNATKGMEESLKKMKKKQPIRLNE